MKVRPNPVYGLPPQGQRLIDSCGTPGTPGSRISGIVSGLWVARADMESTNTGAPIVARDTRGLFRGFS